MKVQSHALWLIALVLLTLTNGVWAADEGEGIMNRMFAPGPLIEGHKDLEGSDCLKCHDAGKGINQTLCLSCHKEIKKYVDLKKGYHGLQKQSCIECHSDHKGRSFDSVQFDTKTFDHKKTGYILEGKHADIQCAKCHQAKRTDKPIRPGDTRYLEKQSTCVSCHKKDDIHFYQPGKFAKQDCNACHGLKTWKDDITFNHKRDTGYALNGKHAESKCQDCHGPTKLRKQTVYKWPTLKKAECLACHKDQHLKNLGPKLSGGGKCLSCHTEQNWKVENFDHKKTTSYPLKGKHAESKCIDCHKQRPEIQKKGLGFFKFAGLKQDCLSCHKDQHRGNLSAKFSGSSRCLECHSMNGWSIEPFNHKVTGYPLRGKHSELKCVECHKQAANKPMAIMAGTTAGQAPTASPHIGSLKFTGLKQNCLSCHTDEHRFGKYSSRRFKKPNDCLVCHNETDWKKQTQFDHRKDAHYALTGEHQTTSCAECHLQKMPISLKPIATGTEPRFSKLPVGVYHWNNLKQKDCETCHTNPHVGQFSQKLLNKKCAECHTTEGWYNQKGGKFDHSKTRFALDGAHTKVKCLDCHSKDGKKIYKWSSVDQKFCNECHATPHKEQFNAKLANAACVSCHKTSDWNSRLSFDHDKTRQPLKGAHGELKCADCHTPTSEKFALLRSATTQHFKSQYLFPQLAKEQCMTCHTDIHKGQLDRNCLECHNEQKWKPVSFDHNKQSAYKLLHKHLDVKCSECHKANLNQVLTENGKSFPLVRYKPISSECLTCHKDVHNGEFGQRCVGCHTERDWKVTREFHKNFTLNGIHFTLECAECHRDGRRLSGLSQNCAHCHKKDDVHGGALPSCGDCHRQQFWESTVFHHSQTRFPLRGVHRTLECADCHRGNVMQGLSATCLSCHQSEASHHGTPLPAGFTDCKNCHHSFTFQR